MKKEDLLIIGAGNVGGFIVNNQELFDQEYNILGFLDDDEEKKGKFFWGYEVLGKVKDIADYDGISVALGIASPLVKKAIFKKLDSSKYRFPRFVAKNAWLSKDVTVGNGVIIYPGVSINYSSVIGEFVVINMNCALGHHSLVSSFSALAPGVNFGGFTHLEECVDMGIGSSTVQNIRIGRNSVIGGQCMVIKNVMPDSKVVGVPGNKINS